MTSDQRNDGGPAFPTAENIHDPRATGVQYIDGMTLRDWYAGMALFTLANELQLNMVLKEGAPSSRPDCIAAFAGAVADAMLAERKESQ